MSFPFTLKILTDFASAHTLRNYPGACSRMHGHNWKVEVEVKTATLDEMGMGMDFKRIKKITREVTEQLDHRYLNDLPAFQNINPTAENIAVYIFNSVSKLINTEHIRVKSITLWETERACVRYEP